MRFPVVLKTPDAGEPDTTIYYEVASNGIFQVRDFGIYRAVTPADRAVPGLLPQTQNLEIYFPRLPSPLLEEVLAFFAEVYRRYEAEAIAIVFYHPGLQTFEARVPPQTIPMYRDYRGQWRAYLEVKYRSVPRPDGFLRLGTIHSHADLFAFSSYTDCKDEHFEDGLHVVFGSFDRPTLSRSASFVANGVRFRLEPDEVMEPCSVPDGPARPDWMAEIEIEKRSSPSYSWVWTGYRPVARAEDDDGWDTN